MPARWQWKPVARGLVPEIARTSLRTRALGVSFRGLHALQARTDSCLPSRMHSLQHVGHWQACHPERDTYINETALKFRLKFSAQNFKCQETFMYCTTFLGWQVSFGSETDQRHSPTGDRGKSNWNA